MFYKHFIDCRLHNLEMCWDLSKPNNLPTCFVSYRKTGFFSTCFCLYTFLFLHSISSAPVVINWNLAWSRICSSFVVSHLYLCSNRSSKMLATPVEVPSRTQDIPSKIIIISALFLLFKFVGLLSLVIMLEISEEYHWSSTTSNFL